MAFAVAAATSQVFAVCSSGPVTLLSAPERTRAASFRRSSDRRDFVAAHALVRMCAAAAVGKPPAALVVTQRCERCGGPHGRPVLAGCDGWHVSLSHSNGVVAAAVAQAPVGVDIERVDTGRFDPALFESVLTAKEAAFVKAAPSPPEAFLRLWVRKESLVKLGVVGLGELALIDLTTASAELRLLDWLHDAPPAVASAASSAPLELVTLAALVHR